VRKRLSPYGKDDIRYVQSIDEEIEMYSSVKVEDIRSLHADFLSNQAIEISAVGDFESDELKSMLKTELSDWDSSIKYARVDRDPRPDIKGSTDLIETPDKANAFLYSSQQYALSDSDADYASLVLGNFILGGGSLSSRLGERVRQQEGLSYGVRSGVSARAKDKRVDFTLYAITNPGNKDRLVEVLREEIDRIRDEGITQKELDESKTAYLQAARVRRSKDSELAGELSGTMFLERTMQHHADHEKHIEAATVDSVNAAIKKYIDPDKLVMAIAGDFASVADKTEE
ncbi:MAG: M16 family metallopeptidase, partial [Rubripirellula sp.]